ncbi:MAG TPA: P1 family peptidase [bacterium]|nr:P1 family peptidase [bacterium]
MITDVPGLMVGHATDLEHLTGCTVVVCADGAVAGASVLGGAPGTRETDLLRPENMIDAVHAVALCGGSAFGLAAADGVVRYLASRGAGFPTPHAKVPIVPAAVIYDLGIGSPDVRPDVEMGEAACRAARPGPVAEGCVGAGTGATVGKLFGMRGAMKSGVGTWSTRLPGGATVGALLVTNAFGDVMDVRTGKILAGARRPDRGGFVGAAEYLRTHGLADAFPHNTTLGVVATDARLTKAHATRLAILAHAGLARAVAPSHTSVDGDTMFVLSTGKEGADWMALQAAVQEAVAEAIMRSVRAARTLGGVPGLAGE